MPTTRSSPGSQQEPSRKGAVHPSLGRRRSERMSHLLRVTKPTCGTRTGPCSDSGVKEEKGAPSWLLSAAVSPTPAAHCLGRWCLNARRSRVHLLEFKPQRLPTRVRSHKTPCSPAGPPRQRQQPPAQSLPLAPGMGLGPAGSHTQGADTSGSGHLASMHDLYLLSWPGTPGGLQGDRHRHMHAPAGVLLSSSRPAPPEAGKTAPLDPGRKEETAALAVVGHSHGATVRHCQELGHTCGISNNHVPEMKCGTLPCQAPEAEQNSCPSPTQTLDLEVCPGKG